MSTSRHHSYEQVNTNTDQRPRSEGPGPWCTTRHCVIILCVSLLINIGFGSFTLYKFLSNEPVDSEVKVGTVLGVDDTVCLSCSSTKDFSPSQVTKVKIGDQSSSLSVCCFQHLGSIKTLIRLLIAQYYHDITGLVVKREDIGESSDDIPRHSTQSAHLYLQKESLTQQAGRLFWDRSGGYGAAHVTDSLDYNNGSLRVSRGGLYYIYSFLTFTRPEESSDVVHSVQRYNSNLSGIGSHTLLMRSTSLKERASSSFLAANLKLRPDDEIYVHVTNMQAIYKYSLSNYFGLIKL